MTRSPRLSWLISATCLVIAAPAAADEYLIYTDGGIPGNGTDVWIWCENSNVVPCDFAERTSCDTPEGTAHFRQQGVVQWQGWGVFHNLDPGPDGTPGTGDEFPTPVDLSAFLGGEVRAWVKSPFDLNLEMQCDVGGATKGGFLLMSDTNWDGTDTWQEIVFPISAFDFGAGPPLDMAECLSKVLSPWMSTGANLGIGLHTFRVDNVRWRAPNSHAGASPVQISGRQLLVDSEPFVINGMAYTPISVGEDWHGALIDRPDRYLVDFPRIAAAGANTVRIYSSYMTTAMLDAAWTNGLYVIPTFPVDPLKLTCQTGKDFMRNRFVDMVQQWKNHPAILAWLVGNEVNVNLGTADLCADWYPQLDAMAQAAHTAEGASFHPVGTANSDSGLADMCQFGCSDDTSLPNLDFWGAQVYRGCSFGTLFSDYAGKSDCSRPLVVTEFGVDAWDSLSGPSGAENQTMQAVCLASLLDEADQALAVRSPGGVSTGQIVFEWADEWWKAFALDPPVAGFCSVADATEWTSHDTCKNWENFGYPDPAMNEEWWGITSLSGTDPNARNPRAAQAEVSVSWLLGDVCNMNVTSFDPGTGSIAVTYDPAPGSTDHTLYYGPLGSLSDYVYTGMEAGLGATGSATATLPAGDLFILAVGRDGTAEGGYGTGVTERPPSPSAPVPQDALRTGLCSTP